MEIGKIDEFRIVSSTDSGHFIVSTDMDMDDELKEEIFMPHLRHNKTRSLELTINQVTEAFIYQNEDGELTASLLLPYAEVEEFILLEVVATQEFGAFLDWGLEKDLFVSIKKQKVPMDVGELHLVRICYDADTGKIYGTTKFGSFLETLDFNFEEGEKVDIIPAEEHELGFRCIVNRKFIGMIYHNEIFSDIKIDEEYQGHVKKIREDGLVDVTLQASGIQNLNESQTKIIKMLQKNGGTSKLHDKSSPVDIKQELGMSKQSFKNAIGMLYKARKILISKSGIELVKNDK